MPWDFFTDEEPLDTALLRLAGTVGRAIPDANAVTGSLMDQAQPRTAASTYSCLVEVDEKQHSVGRGPCLEAACTVRTVRAVAFDPFDEGLMRLFTTAASATIASAQRWQRSLDHIGSLERALLSRAVIYQARGILMAVHSCTADDAFKCSRNGHSTRTPNSTTEPKNLLDSVTRF